MTHPETDRNEALFLVTHEHSIDDEDEEHRFCTKVIVRRLYEDVPHVRYLPMNMGVLPLFTTDRQMIDMTHEHIGILPDNAYHKNCRQVICRELCKNATLRYLYGANTLQFMTSHGTLEQF